MDKAIQTDKDLLAKVADVAGMVEYQNGAVVSRTIMDRPTGTVTLFSFDKGQGLSEHTAPFDALISILDGSAEIRIGGTPHHLSAGDMIVLPSGVPHAVNATERFRMLLAMIRSE